MTTNTSSANGNSQNPFGIYNENGSWTSPFGTYDRDPVMGRQILETLRTWHAQLKQMETFYETATPALKANMTRNDIKPLKTKIAESGYEDLNLPPTSLNADESLERMLEAMYSKIDRAKDILTTHAEQLAVAASNEAWWYMTEDHTLSPEAQEEIWVGRFTAEVLRYFAHHSVELGHGDAYLLWQVRNEYKARLTDEILSGYDEAFKSTSLVSNMLAHFKQLAKKRFIKDIWGNQDYASEMAYNDNVLNRIENLELPTDY